MSLPRGIQELKRINKDGSVVLRYRVQINKKHFKADKLFDEKDEAIEFLNASKSFTGTSQIKLLEEQKKKRLQVFEDFIANPTISTYIDKYIVDHIDDQFEQYDPSTAEGKIKLRNYKSTKTFFNTIKKTEIPERADEEFNISPLFFKGITGKKPLGQFKPTQITYIEINEYIKARLKQGIKPISVERELTHISNLFKKLRHYDPRLKSHPHPCLDYDRDLLKKRGNKVTKKAFRLTEDDRTKLFKVLDEYHNPEVGQIVKLMLLTAMRRSEAVLLKWSQIKDNHIELFNTKSGTDRYVFLIPQAQELLKSIPKRPDDDRLFRFTVLGFDGSYQKILKNNGLLHIKSHALRKESVSNFIEQIGGGNSLLIAEFLGMNVKGIEKTINENSPPTDLSTQSGVLKAIGHSSTAVTHGHYFSLKK